MEQTSKHSPRIDDAITHDTASLLHGAPVESRSQEERLQEDPSVDPGIRPEARRLSADEHFVNVQAVWTALGGPAEDSHT